MTGVMARMGWVSIDRRSRKDVEACGPTKTRLDRYERN
jgi:hypothetical protein